MRLHAVILAGGRGERFWPLSRRARPKQFLPLLGDRPMLAHTLERLQGLVDPRDLWIVTSRDLKSQAEAIAREVPKRQVIGEPVGRNTAPAMALASWLIPDGADSVVLVLPSDHRIEPADRFREELRRAAETSLLQKAIVTFGVPPTRPETGYGYIETGDPIAPGSPFHRVTAFREKPDAAAAAKYVAGGGHRGVLREGALHLDRLRGHGALEGRARGARRVLLGRPRLVGGDRSARITGCPGKCGRGEGSSAGLQGRDRVLRRGARG